jgi:hypothetical protein
MKYLIPFFTAALSLTAQTMPAVPQELLGKAVAVSHGPQAHARATAAANNPARVVGDSYELAVTSDFPLTVPPGQFTPLPQSLLDFSGATHASIAVTSLGADLTGLRIVAAWAAPDTWFNMTDASPKGSFPVLDHGGLYAPAYGPGLKVLLYNESSAPLVIKQISVYATK